MSAGILILILVDCNAYQRWQKYTISLILYWYWISVPKWVKEHNGFHTHLYALVSYRISQYSHLITRRCREHNVYAELMPCTAKISDLKFKPKGKIDVILYIKQRFDLFAGVILSGSPYSVYDKDAPHVDPAVFNLGVPILGICYGLQVCPNWCLSVDLTLTMWHSGIGVESEGWSL